MPYIVENDRKDILEVHGYQKTLTYLSTRPLNKFLGELNFMIFLTVKAWIQKNGKRYFHFAAIVGTLVCCVFEIYRRLIGKYEDQAIEKNGDV